MVVLIWPGDLMLSKNDDEEHCILRWFDFISKDLTFSSETLVEWQCFRCILLSSCGNNGDSIALPRSPTKRVSSITGAEDFATIAADTMKVSGRMKQFKQVCFFKNIFLKLSYLFVYYHSTIEIYTGEKCIPSMFYFWVRRHKNINFVILVEGACCARKLILGLKLFLKYKLS